MNFKDLAYFTRLVDRQSFSRVAEDFQVTQPAVSAALRRLEKELAIPLVDRRQSRREVTLTPAGNQFYAHASRILNEYHRSQQDLASLEKGTVRLGLPPIISQNLLPQLAPALQEANLFSALKPVEGGSNQILKKLLAGELDAAFIGTAGNLPSDTLDVEELTSAEFAIIVSQQHPLANRNRVSFSEFVDDPFIMLEPGYVQDNVFHQLSDAGITPKIRFQTSQVELIKQLVAVNAGVSLLIDLAISQSDPLIALPLLDDVPPFRICLVTRKGQHPNAATQAFIDLVRHELKGA